MFSDNEFEGPLSKMLLLACKLNQYVVTLRLWYQDNFLMLYFIPLLKYILYTQRVFFTPT